MLALLLPNADIAAGKLATKMLSLIFVPLAIGLYLKANHEATADRIAHYGHKTSSLIGAIWIALGFGANAMSIFGLFGTRAIGAALVLIAATLLVGCLLG